MKQYAKNKRVNFGPSVRALIDIMGDTMESVIFEDDQDEQSISFLDDEELDVTVQDEFHDAAASPPTSPAN